MVGAAIIAVCFGIPLTVFAGALLFERFESFVASKLRDESGCDWTDPDGGLAATAEVNVFHIGTSSRGVGHDHGARG
jgi:hypothetical protein